MLYHRMTVSIPDYTYHKLMKVTKPRERSKFVTDALEKEIEHLSRTDDKDPIDDFISELKHGKKVPGTSNELIANMRKGLV